MNWNLEVGVEKEMMFLFMLKQNLRERNNFINKHKMNIPFINQVSQCIIGSKKHPDVGINVIENMISFLKRLMGLTLVLDIRQQIKLLNHMLHEKIFAFLLLIQKMIDLDIT